MGAAASRPLTSMVVTLDGLGTVYRFKAPLVAQYRMVAKQCGLDANFEAEAHEKLVRDILANHVQRFPNYGKGALKNPEAWWNGVASTSFKSVIGDQELPSDLGRRLYSHFSSPSAYELFPDVKPFLSTINALRRQYSDPKGPMVILGMVTNSDCRVREVLNGLSLRVGPSRPPSNLFEEVNSLSEREKDTAVIETPWYNFYNSNNDFDFLLTSYEMEHAKPHPGAFFEAKRLAFSVHFSRSEQSMAESPSLMRNSVELIKAAWDVRMQSRHMKRIHIGSDINVDYHGARTAGVDALWLARDTEIGQSAHNKSEQPEETVTNLEDAAVVISLMAQQTFGPGKS